MKVRSWLFIAHARWFLLSEGWGRIWTRHNSMESVGNPATILLVDDDEAVRGFSRRILIQQGFHVIEASDGAEALEVASVYAQRKDVCRDHRYLQAAECMSSAPAHTKQRKFSLFPPTDGAGLTRLAQGTDTWPGVRGIPAPESAARSQLLRPILPDHPRPPQTASA
jgi:hypothetical protein